jgi:hypothetical protein
MIHILQITNKASQYLRKMRWQARFTTLGSIRISRMSLEGLPKLACGSSRLIINAERLIRRAVVKERNSYKRASAGIIRNIFISSADGIFSLTPRRSIFAVAGSSRSAGSRMLA